MASKKSARRGIGENANVDPQAVAASFERTGSKAETGRELGISEKTVRYHLNKLGVNSKPLFGGRMDSFETVKKPLPKKGEVRRYILSSAQSCTKVNQKFWDNLVAFAEWADAEIMIARYTYNHNNHGKLSVKPGTRPSKQSELWFDPQIEEFICDEDPRGRPVEYQLAPGLIFAANMNTLPTNVWPLSGLQTHTQRNSGIFPHSTVAMDSVASMWGEPTKFNYTTGTVTLRNYVQKRAGQKAELHHVYAALLVEVDENHNWFVHQIIADKEGRFYSYIDNGQEGIVCVEQGEIFEEIGCAAFQPGDAHFSEADMEVFQMLYGEGGIVDTLHPAEVHWHDAFSMRSRTHHEMKSFKAMYEKHLRRFESVEDEVKLTAERMEMAYRDWCDWYVISSNHDRHLDQWIEEADYRKDPINALYYSKLLTPFLQAVVDDDPTFVLFEYAVKEAGAPAAIKFLPLGGSRIICGHKGGGIECGLHGDLGPNGARGNARTLSNMGRRANIGHSHSARIVHGVYQAGTSSMMDLGYNSGQPSSWSHSHIVTYPNGKRAIMTCWNGKWRA